MCFRINSLTIQLSLKLQIPLLCIPVNVPHCLLARKKTFPNLHQTTQVHVAFSYIKNSSDPRWKGTISKKLLALLFRWAVLTFIISELRRLKLRKWQILFEREASSARGHVTAANCKMSQREGGRVGYLLTLLYCNIGFSLKKKFFFKAKICIILKRGLK